MLGGLTNTNCYQKLCKQITHQNSKQQSKQISEATSIFILISSANCINLYDKKQGILINRFVYHDSTILDFVVESQNQEFLSSLNNKKKNSKQTRVISIDQQGQLIVHKVLGLSQQSQHVNLKFQNKINVLKKSQLSSSDKNDQNINSNIKSSNIKIKQAKILLQSQKLFYITNFNILYEFNLKTQINKKVGMYSKISKIDYATSSIFLFSNDEQRELIILNIDKFEVIYYHQHQNLNKNKAKILCSTVVKETSVAIGDQNGKIYILQGILKTKNSQNPKIIKLQWHLHSIYSLISNGNYLYSGGQQGTVVIWHLRDGTKDFLPRIGPSIKNIFIQNSLLESSITCFLSDNTVKSIDLNQDKKVTQYKTIIDPQGYQTKKIINHKKDYNQSQKKFKEYNFNKRQETLCLNSLPGKLQFINLRSAQNTQLSVIKRNYISRLDNDYPNPHQIISTAFNKNWSLLATAVQGQNHSSLHFYHQQNNQWKLITKILNPHYGKIQKCFCLSSSSLQKDNNNIFYHENKNSIFVTYSLQDPNIKIWKLKKQKKKSILEIDQQFWACQFQINYRNVLPLSISIVYEQSQEKIISITYSNHIVLYDVLNGNVLKEINIKNAQQFYAFRDKENQNLSYIYQISNKVYFQMNLIESRLNKEALLSAQKTKSKKSITPKKTTKNSNLSSIKSLQISQALQHPQNKIELYPSYQNSKVAIHCFNKNTKISKIFIYNYQLEKIEQSFQIPITTKNQMIEILFWFKERLIILTNNLVFYDIIHGKQLFECFSKNVSIQQKTNIKNAHHMDVQSAQTGINYIDIQMAQQRWVNKQTKKKKNLLDDIGKNMNTSPSFITGFKLLSENILL